MEKNISFKIIYLRQNQGHGNARRIGLSNCSNNLVALMDADDISLPDRFFYQLHAFASYESIDVVGGQITEFIGEPSNVVGKRTVPEEHNDIKKFMKKRCPMNQVSVMFKKSSVEKAGGYLDWYCEEDYYLWIRMFKNGSKFKNVRETLVNVRIGDEMSARRGGWRYFKSERGIQRLLLKMRYISIFRYFYNVTIRFFGEVVASNKLRTKLFKRMRSDKSNIEKSALNSEIKDSSLLFEPFSVSICVYDGDNPDWFDSALSSIVNQSIKPSEIILVVDGPINKELTSIIQKWQRDLDSEVVCNYQSE